MTTSKSHVPVDFHTLKPHLTVRRAGEAIDFYCKAFGARELFRNSPADSDAILHAELLLGHSSFYLNDEFPDNGYLSPESLGGTAVSIALQVDDADACFRRAVDAGAEVVEPLVDRFWGDRYGVLRDPHGHRWEIIAQLDDPSPEEHQRRSDEFFGKD